MSDTVLSAKDGRLDKKKTYWLCGIYILLKMHGTYSSIHKGFLRSPPWCQNQRNTDALEQCAPSECVSIPTLCPLPHTS